jgi:arginase
MALPSFRSITVILSPYHVGIANKGVGRGPMYLKQRGAINAMRENGIPVHETTVPSVEDELDGEISRSFELFRRTADTVRDAHEASSFPIVFAGNCSASVGVAAGLSDAVDRLAAGGSSGSGLGCVWFDAHDDFNTPETMTSGYFDSMPIAMLGGLCFRSMLPTVPGFREMDLGRVVHMGMRDVNDIERQHVEEAGLSVVWGGRTSDDSVDFEAGLGRCLAQKGTERQPTLVHVDADSLDTSIGRANGFAAPGGLLREDLQGCLRTVSSKTVPMALTVASLDPGCEGADSVTDVLMACISAFVESLKAKGLFDTGKQ